MHQVPRSILVVAVLSLPTTAAAQKSVSPKEASAMAHAREELGINGFTAPSIEQVFDVLQTLRPIPFDKAWRDLPDTPPQNRAQLALAAGGVIADGFLAVAAQRQSRIESVGRLLLKLGKGLGVGDHVTRHSRSILEQALQKRWSDVQLELVRAQADAEAGLMALKDEEIAHLVSLGGWLRGLEITATTVAENYTPARAGQLRQPELFDYFLARVETLNPAVKKTPVIAQLDQKMREVRVLIARSPDAPPLSLEEVKRVRNTVREINKIIVRGEEP